MIITDGFEKKGVKTFLASEKVGITFLCILKRFLKKGESKELS